MNNLTGYLCASGNSGFTNWHNKNHVRYLAEELHFIYVDGNVTMAVKAVTALNGMLRKLK